MNWAFTIILMCLILDYKKHEDIISSLYSCHFDGLSQTHQLSNIVNDEMVEQILLALIKEKPLYQVLSFSNKYLSPSNLFMTL